MHPVAESVGLENPCGDGNKNKNKQDNGKSNTESQRLNCLFGLFFGFMFNQMKQGGAETDNYQNKGNNDDTFDNHGRVMLDGKIFLFSVINAFVPIG